MEFKRTTGTLTQAFQTVSAFLNAKGGTVLIGLNDDGSFADFKVGKDTLVSIANYIRDISPGTNINVHTYSRPGDRHLIEISVHEGNEKPYTYKHISYKRILNSTSEMPRSEYDRLILEQHHSHRRWESEPVSGMNVSDIHPAELSQFIQDSIIRGRLDDPLTSDPMQLLEKLDLARDGVILRAGAVAFGTKRFLTSHFPQCKLSFAKFYTESTDLIDVIYHIEGNVFHLLRKAETLIRDNMVISSRLSGNHIARADIPQFPMKAVREALANAFCHRDYSISGVAVQISMYPDRLEVLSPGSLHFGLTVDDLYTSHPSMRWNPNLAKLLFRRGIIEEFGTGIQRMVNAMAESGGHKPLLEAKASSIRVTIKSVLPHSTSSSAPPPPGLTSMPQQADGGESVSLNEQIMVLFDQSPDGLPLRNIIENVDVADFEQIRYALNTLKDDGILMTIGRGAGSKWVRKK